MSLEKPFVFVGVFSTDKAKGASDRRERDRLLGGVYMVERFDDLKLQVEVMRAKIDTLERVISSSYPLIDKGMVEVCEGIIDACVDNIRLSSGLLCEELQDALITR